MKLIKKVFMFVLILTLVSVPILSLADYTDPSDPNIFNVKGNPDNPIIPKLLLFSGSILDIIRIVGSLVALGMLIWIGIKWITSTAQERADLKQKAVNYVIGAVFIFGASYILPLLVEFIQSSLE